MSSSSSTKACFNSSCKDALERARKGWRRRTGEFADLCDRCAFAYEEGKFCETFHLKASGWRCCESCGKQIHCGCIVSFHMFVLLDAGGIECITCARKIFILTPNPAWPPPSLFLPVPPERTKDLSAKSGPVPWLQTPSLFSSSSAQSDLQPRIPFEVVIPSGIDRLTRTERLSASSFEKKKLEDSYERLVNSSLKLGAVDILENGNAGISCGEQANPSVNMPHKSPFSNNDTSTSHFSVAVSAVSPNKAEDQTKVYNSHAPRPTPSTVGHNGVEPFGDSQICNGRPRVDARVRNQLLPRYWPRISDQGLQKISGDSNFVITPLFEKMLSTSDAGRIGRLVLPKKCAEAYFPLISQPEGLPLKVQDSKGKEWIFQFRFWPNNNSRMYVLEGVTPCIQSMQLQAGDIVTFSRMEPEGKLVMGFRKASTAAPSDQGSEPVNASNGVSTNGDISARKIETGEVLSKSHQLNGNLVTSGCLPINQANSADQASPWSKDAKCECISKEVLGAKSSFHGTKKNSTLGSKSKRLRIEKEDVIQLKLTWEQAQGLLCPPPNHVPSVVVIDDFEFEEYEDAPIIGRPTIFAADHFGSSCSAAQELTAEQLEDLLPVNNRAVSKKMKSAKQDPDSVDLEGLDALADLAIQEEGEGLNASSLTTMKHPRHRLGCSCIVCIQPPSGKGPKHKKTCTCNVCLMVRRHFRTLTLRREKKLSEKEAEAALQKLQQHPNFPEIMSEDNIRIITSEGNSSPNEKMVSTEVPADDPSRMRLSSLSPFKGQIDLNIQPERDEELSPGSDSDSATRMLQYAAERDLRQQRFSCSNDHNSTDQMQLSGNGVGQNFGNSIIAFHLETELERTEPLSANAPPASISAIER
ncbi:B3 domain-containing protein Os07g0563300-like [Actinidia eriantha]|uniref:B3 domain-containing protein Os07g0563300-like n=1 Tax=Actinidia eriantha TaxID=165200 RepID=UPI0025876B19|nr:B3 domain-containing protein Os07g0563300-like [Actinidia eriantha]